jgi:hypothetical protein
MKKEYSDRMLENLQKFSSEEICEELYKIKNDLLWLQDDIALTTSQRQLFVDICHRVKKMLGC